MSQRGLHTSSGDRRLLSSNPPSNELGTVSTPGGALGQIVRASDGLMWLLFHSRTLTVVFSVIATVFVLNLQGGGANCWNRSDADTMIVKADLGNAIATPMGRQAQEQLLILTPLRNAEKYLDEYFDNIGKLNYPKNLISLAFLISDTTDGTVKKLNAIAASIAAKADKQKHYHTITILIKDFHFQLPETIRHAYELQPTRRSFMARARNYLLTSALNEKHAWVLWLDVDVIRYDPDVLTDLMTINKDIVVPNCLRLTQGWEYYGYERNAWAHTEQSLALAEKMGPDYVTVGGYHEFPTFRYHLVDMPTHMGNAYVPLDAIGGTFTLVKARVHREGANFPTYPVDGLIETEGFAAMAKKMGFEVVGVPGILVFHAENN
ncbi:glycosyltransferase family 62 protein [Mixia osmundae IAM 14324]|uniref:Glycosyltransferase family 62 protein n=1 Tax=Mixia osmundae (strain CBS 9802 / IAM 14324 / JCM 22182 / KY 12970) TaxID=764103 RepID=G7E3V4_MIXOS|nr:glycosyltransferase family 62 protein [Mixia osmundae IAM 14324]KEI41959.1 glycosyltransferase family 62 protein [Mixia osmundae IAM 14324]GAA97514.1 hypothetical protein E5Q_04192 [Mixia osmundae IAM 14324]